MATGFYTFDQNNSGGYFVRDEQNGVGEIVIIEAESAKQAVSILERIGDNVSSFWDYCPCCGERWSTWVDESDRDETPSLYGKPLAELEPNCYRQTAFVHYLNGDIKKINIGEANP